MQENQADDKKCGITDTGVNWGSRVVITAVEWFLEKVRMSL